MKFLLNNLKMALDPRLILTTSVCFLVSLICGFNTFPHILRGVSGNFEIYTSIPWIALIFPYFIIAGAYLASAYDISLFTLLRLNSTLKYYFYFYVTLLFSSCIYGILLSTVALIFGEALTGALLTALLLSLNLLLIASVQAAVFLITKNPLISIGAVLIIILASLFFPEARFNIGAWGMLLRSNCFLKNGFDITFTLIIEAILTVFINALTAVFIKKQGESLCMK